MRGRDLERKSRQDNNSLSHRPVLKMRQPGNSGHLDIVDKYASQPQKGSCQQGRLQGKLLHLNN